MSPSTTLLNRRPHVPHGGPLPDPRDSVLLQGSPSLRSVSLLSKTQPLDVSTPPTVHPPDRYTTDVPSDFLFEVLPLGACVFGVWVQRRRATTSSQIHTRTMNNPYWSSRPL